VSPHSLRHYFGSSLISQGVSVVAVARWLGHSSPEITRRVYSYLMTGDEQIGPDAMTKAMQRLVPSDPDVYPMCTRQGAE
jgi:integrase